MKITKWSKLLSFFKSIFSEKDGTGSSTRVCFIFMVIVVIGYLNYKVLNSHPEFIITIAGYDFGLVAVLGGFKTYKDKQVIDSEADKVEEIK